MAKAGDISLHYNEAGEGPVLVMLHGGGPGASSWSNFKQNLLPLSKHFRVLLVDQPGYGRSDKPEINEPFWTYSARAVRALLDELLGAVSHPAARITREARHVRV